MKLLLLCLLFSDVAYGKEYIVISSNRVSNFITTLLTSYDIKETFYGAVSGFKAELSEEEVEALRKTPGVDLVEEDITYTAQDVDSWGLDRIDARDGLDNMFTPVSDGKGSAVFILDTGINPDHKEFTGRIIKSKDFTDSKSGPVDMQGHGTHVAGTVAGTYYGVAKKADIYSAKVLDDSGRGSTAGIIQAINWTIEEVQKREDKRGVINLSLGAPVKPGEAWKRAIDAARGNGVSVVVAAGNSDMDACNYSPAGVRTAITVGSIKIDDTRSSFSNWGKCVDLFAPGSSITSAAHDSNSGYKVFSGTSMAAPHVAGAIAVMYSLDKNLGVKDAENLLLALTSKEKIDDVNGSANLLLYVGGKPVPPKDPDLNYYLSDLGGTCVDICARNGLGLDIDAIKHYNHTDRCQDLARELGVKFDKIKMVKPQFRNVGCSLRVKPNRKIRLAVSLHDPDVGSKAKFFRRLCVCK